jgi:hypothetical protein
LPRSESRWPGDSIWRPAVAGAFGALLVVLSVRSAPLPLRDALLVERNLPSGKLLRSGRTEELAHFR